MLFGAGVILFISRLERRAAGVAPADYFLRRQLWLIIFGLLAGALFTAIVGSLGVNFVWQMSRTDSVSADLEIPMWIVYLAVPLGSYLMSFRFLQVTWSFLKTGELPKHDHAHVGGLDTPHESHA